MHTFIVEKAHANKKLLRFISLNLKITSINVLNKALKNKDIKINGKRVTSDMVLSEGDKVELYLPDKFLAKENKTINSKEKLLKEGREFQENIVYEDENILIFNKMQEMAVHSGSSIKSDEDTLISLAKKITGNRDLALMHRLDRNTGGLIIFGKSQKILRLLANMQNKGQIHKRYRCLVKNIPDYGEEVKMFDGALMKKITAYLEKSKNSNEVFIHQEKQEDDVAITSFYRVLNVFTNLQDNDDVISEIEVELLSGKKHQIRAHFAAMQNPILGDGLYGRQAFNNKYLDKKGKKIKNQQLFASSITFGNNLPSELRYLQNKTFSLNPNYALKLKNN